MCKKGILILWLVEKVYQICSSFPKNKATQIAWTQVWMCALTVIMIHVNGDCTMLLLPTSSMIVTPGHLISIWKRNGWQMSTGDIVSVCTRCCMVCVHRDFQEQVAFPSLHVSSRKSAFFFQIRTMTMLDSDPMDSIDCNTQLFVSYTFLYLYMQNHIKRT